MEDPAETQTKAFWGSYIAAGDPFPGQQGLSCQLLRARKVMRPSPLSLRLRDALTVEDRLDLSASSPGLLSVSASTDQLFTPGSLGRDLLFPFLPSPAGSENARSSPESESRPLGKVCQWTILIDWKLSLGFLGALTLLTVVRKVTCSVRGGTL